MANIGEVGQSGRVFWNPSAATLTGSAYLMNGRRQALFEEASCLLTELEFVTIHLSFTMFHPTGSCFADPKISPALSVDIGVIPLELRKSLRQRDPNHRVLLHAGLQNVHPIVSGLIRKQGTVVDGEAGAVPQGQHLGVHFLTKLTQKPGIKMIHFTMSRCCNVL